MCKVKNLTISTNKDIERMMGTAGGLSNKRKLRERTKKLGKSSWLVTERKKKKNTRLKGGLKYFKGKNSGTSEWRCAPSIAVR